jgi:hypothetical protein
MELVTDKGKQILVPTLEEFCTVYPIIATEIGAERYAYHPNYFNDIKKNILIG